MATIQIRDLPEETYETIRRRARAADPFGPRYTTGARMLPPDL